MTYSEADLYQFVINNLLIFFRIAAIFTVAPMFSSQLVPLRIRLIMAIALSLVIAPTVEHRLAMPDFTLELILICGYQFLIGAVIGFIFQLIFQVLIIAGQIIAMQSGLGFASLIDPSSGASVPVVSQFYLLLFTLVFLALNGHLLLIELMAKSFVDLPLSASSISSDNLWKMVMFSSIIFKGAVLVSLPAIVSLLLVNLSFGVLARAAPQLNIFAVGFPISLVLGLILIYLTLSGVLPLMVKFLESGFDLSHVMVKN